MGLKTTQQTALTNFAALITLAATGIRQVFTDPPDSLNQLPALVVFDEGFHPRRAGQWQEIEWRLRLQVFVQRGKLATALKACRDIRGDLVDQLDTDITLGNAVSRTTWGEEGLRLVGLEYGAGQANEYAGLDGQYVLWIREAKAFT